MSFISLNENEFAGKLNPMHGELKSWWGKLTDIIRRHPVPCLLILSKPRLLRRAQLDGVSKRGRASPLVASGVQTPLANSIDWCWPWLFAGPAHEVKHEQRIATIYEPSFGSLLGGIVIDAKDLLMRQAALTKLEVSYELRKGLSAAIALGIGLGIVAGGGMLLMLMLVQGLAVFTVVPLWAGYGIVGSALIVLGRVVLAAGRTKAEALDLVPQRAAERIKQSAQWLTKQRTSNKRYKKPVKISRITVRR